MNAVLHPVGPRPERVYWRRRVVVLLALVTAVLLVWNILSGSRGSAAAGDGVAAATDSRSGTATDDAGEAGSGDEAAEGAADPADAAPGGSGEGPDTEGAALEPVAGGPLGCDVADLALMVTTDARSYPAGAQPVFSVTLANTGSTTCVVDAAMATRQVEVMSGADRIWSSADCGEPASESLALLEPGARTEATVTWSRARSAAGCPEDLPEPQPGTYTATATALGATSATAVFDLE